MTLKKRFEIFKRDSFTCRYCGRKSPSVVLELDHVIPKSKGGKNDEINLVTSCFDCNRGKSDRNLSSIMTGEDPHDKALKIMERERQIAEYYVVMEKVEDRIQSEWLRLANDAGLSEHGRSAVTDSLRRHSYHGVYRAVTIAVEKLGRHSEDYVPYMIGILKNMESDSVSF